MNGTPTGDYAARLEKFRQTDAERDALVAEVIAKYEELQARFEEKCDDFDNEVESRRLWHNKAKTQEQALVEHKQVSGSNSFVTVVIDGDGAIFQDELYRMGKDGGAEAAHRLHNGIKSHLKSLCPEANVDDWNIVVFVVLNLQGLATKLHSCGSVSSPNEVFAFGRSFGLQQPLFSFIDVGSGKERADHKIRETLRLYLPNTQCKHVFFGPCNDNGYLVVLERYRRDYASKLTLIETRPAELGFLELGLKTVRFPEVFRSDNLPSTSIMPRGSISIGGSQLASPSSVNTTTGIPLVSRPSPKTQPILPTIAPCVQESPSPAPATDSAMGSNTWATVGKSNSPGKNIDIASKKTPTRKFCFLNVYDQRLDQELPRLDPNAERRFAERIKTEGKRCNYYHLLSTCDAGEYCQYVHGEKFSAGEQLVLKHKVRALSCSSESSCRNVDCIFGHHCKMGNKCFRSDCWFADTHHMNFTPAKRYFENGEEEWIQAYLDKPR